MKKAKKQAFTLTEVLIALVTIGIIAAIMIPAILLNFNKRAWDTQRKALFTRLTQAIQQMETLGNYGVTIGTGSDVSVAENFILNGLSKVYKINTVCNLNKLGHCGIPEKLRILGGLSEVSFPTKMSELNPVLLQNIGQKGSDEGSNVDTDAAAFTTLNGESIAVFYNPYCGAISTSNHYVQNKMCVNFVYDLNGAQGPNQVGKDIGFITAFYKNDSSVVAPIPYVINGLSASSFSESADIIDAVTSCSTLDKDLRLPDKDELASIFVNALFVNLTEGNYWSGSIISAGINGYAWEQNFADGNQLKAVRSLTNAVRCIAK